MEIILGILGLIIALHVGLSVLEILNEMGLFRITLFFLLLVFFPPLAILLVILWIIGIIKGFFSNN